MTDIQFTDHGSIWTAAPLTDAGRAWIDENLPDDAQWFGGAICIEPRYGAAIVEGMRADGLEVAG